MRDSLLHFGQNKGNFFSVVSWKILTRVLPLQAGHKTQKVARSSIVVATSLMKLLFNERVIKDYMLG